MDHALGTSGRDVDSTYNLYHLWRPRRLVNGLVFMGSYHPLREEWIGFVPNHEFSRCKKRSARCQRDIFQKIWFRIYTTVDGSEFPKNRLLDLVETWKIMGCFSNHQSFFSGRMATVRAWFHDISWHETPIWRQCWWMVLVSRDLFSASNSSNWLGVVKHAGVSFKLMLHFVFQKLPCFEHIQMKAAAPAP